MVSEPFNKFLSRYYLLSSITACMCYLSPFDLETKVFVFFVVVEGLAIFELVCSILVNWGSFIRLFKRSNMILVDINNREYLDYVIRSKSYLNYRRSRSHEIKIIIEDYQRRLDVFTSGIPWIVKVVIKLFFYSIILIMFSWLYGYSSAQEEDTYVIKDYSSTKPLVVLGAYKESLIVAPVNLKKRLIEPRYTLIDKQNILRTVYIMI